MKQFFALLKREFLEWRTVFLVVISLYVVLLILLAYGSFRLSNLLGNETFTMERNGREMILRFDQGQSGDTLGMQPEHGDNQITFPEQPKEILEFWAHFLRTLLVAVNFLIIILAVFYLTDAVFKERSDSSTFYYRSLPVSDSTVMLSKLTFGTVGILLLSYVLSILLVLYVHLMVPRQANAILLANGLSLSQFRYIDLIGDWAEFHFLQLLWLGPFAVYFLLVSTLVKNRPLLTGIGVIVLLALAWRYFLGPLGIPNPITGNFSVFNQVVQDQWLSVPDTISSRSTIELFGSFVPYIFSLRSLISLLVAGGLGWVTLFVYKKNIEVS